MYYLFYHQITVIYWLITISHWNKQLNFDIIYWMIKWKTLHCEVFDITFQFFVYNLTLLKWIFIVGSSKLQVIILSKIITNTNYSHDISCAWHQTIIDHKFVVYVCCNSEILDTYKCKRVNDPRYNYTFHLVHSCYIAAILVKSQNKWALQYQWIQIYDLQWILVL